MLVLADTDGLGVNLHQLGQRVLQAARNRHRATQAHIQLGKLRRRKRRRRIHRRACFAHHDFGDFLFGLVCRHQLDDLGGKFVGLAAGGAVAYRNQLHAVLHHQARQRRQRALPVIARLMRIHRLGCQQLAGGIDHRHLATRAYAGIKPHHRLRPGGRGQQQLMQIASEDFNRFGLGRFA